MTYIRRKLPLEGIWGRGRAVSGPFPCTVPDAP